MVVILLKFTHRLRFTQTFRLLSLCFKMGCWVADIAADLLRPLYVGQSTPGVVRRCRSGLRTVQPSQQLSRSGGARRCERGCSEYALSSLFLMLPRESRPVSILRLVICFNSDCHPTQKRLVLLPESMEIV